MFGRLLAGIATSILYSAFESWLIYEHKQVSHLKSCCTHTTVNHTTI